MATSTTSTSHRRIIARHEAPSSSSQSGFLPQELLYLLRNALLEDSKSPSVARCPDNDCATVWDTADADIRRFHRLLSDSASFVGLDASATQSWPAALTPETLEHSSIQIEQNGVRVAMKTQKAFGKGNRLHEFRSKICMVPGSSAAARHALVAEVCQRITPFGVLSLPPTISWSPVIRCDDPIYGMIDQDDIRGIRRSLRLGHTSVRSCDEYGRGLIHRAAWNGSADLLEMLIEEGVDVDSVTALSSSALLLCCGVDYLRKMRLALEAGADPGLLPDGQFSIAAMGVDVVKTIWRTSSVFIDLKLRNAQGRTLLLVTAATTSNQDQASILRLLLRAGASISEVDPAGNSPVHLFMSSIQPDDTQAVDALVSLLQAGADLALQNDQGLNAVDLACEESEKHGTFRRDLLLQALSKCQISIRDSRLVGPPRYTAIYTSTCFNRAEDNDASSRIRAYLLSDLTDAVDCGSVYVRRKLHEMAVGRVMSRYKGKALPSYDQLHSMALQYLRRMVTGKQQLYSMVTERLPYQSWIPYAQRLPWFKINEDSELAGLLDFDWFLPVDTEDLFATYVDNVIQRIEDQMVLQPENDDLGHLKGVLERALPSFQAMSQRESSVVESIESPPPLTEVPELATSPLTPDTDSHDGSSVESWTTPRERRDSLSPERAFPRRSIQMTPLHMYGPDKQFPSSEDMRIDKYETQDEEALCMDDVRACLAAGNTTRAERRKRRGAPTGS